MSTKPLPTEEELAGWKTLARGNVPDEQALRDALWDAADAGEYWSSEAEGLARRLATTQTARKSAEAAARRAKDAGDAALTRADAAEEHAQDLQAALDAAHREIADWESFARGLNHNLRQKLRD